MQRLFTFGCSFTQYWRWPTWADAMGREYDHFENWGICGSGNSLIFYSLIECHQRNQIKPEDTVYIMWTNTSREDRYIKDRWIEGGNVYWSAGSSLPKGYVENFTCERGFLIRDLTTITATKQLLTSIGCKWKFMSMVPLDRTNLDSDLGSNPDDVVTEDQDVRDLYQDALSSISPSVYQVLFNGNWRSRPGIPDNYNNKTRDFHPTPLEHLEYLDMVCPEITLSSATKSWMAACEEQARANTLKWNNTNQPIERL